MSYALMTIYCLFLFGLQLATGWALMHGHQGSQVAANGVFLFFGINAPSIILGWQLGRDDTTRLLKNPLGLLLMALILFNFMRAGALAGDGSKWNGILHVLSAQALWIAVPTWLALRSRSF